MSDLLRFDQVACIRGERLLFDRINFTLSTGQALWLRGPNGIGKSSLIRLAAGLLRPAAGHIHRHSRVALLDESLALDPERPLRPALDFWARLDGVDGPNVARAMEAMALAPLADVPIFMLSTGQRKRAAMARVIAGCAPLWLLDEPANGLDDGAMTRLVTAIAAHRANGGAVLLASHQRLALSDMAEMELGPLA